MASLTHLHIDDLLDLQHVVAQTQPLSATSNNNVSGQFTSRFRGQGLEFDDLREYTSGDDVRHIDWKVSARYRNTMTRLFKEERDATVTLAVDLRTSMRTGTQSLKSVNAGRLAASLAWHIVRRNYRVALQLLTDDDVFQTRPKAGKLGAVGVCRLLVDVDSKHAITHRNEQSISNTQKPASNNNNLAQFIEHLVHGGRQLGSTVLVSGFDDVFQQADTDQLKDSFALLQAKHQQHAQKLSAIQLVDKYEVEPLPEGQYQYHWRNRGSARSNLVIENKRISSRQSQHLRSVLSEQSETVKALCKQHQVHCINHAGPVRSNSINEIIAHLADAGTIR